MLCFTTLLSMVSLNVFCMASKMSAFSEFFLDKSDISPVLSPGLVLHDKLQLAFLMFCFLVAPSLAMESLTSKRFIQKYAYYCCCEKVLCY